VTPTDDFAAELKRARDAAGFSQAELGTRAGLTGSYVCMLELRRKPAPSADVVAKLARALAIDDARLQQSAALERTPEPVRRRVVRLVRERLRTRRSRDRLLTTTLFHVTRLPGFRTDAFAEAMGLPDGIRPIFGRLTDRVRHVPSADEAAKKSRDLLRELPGKEREALVRALPKILGSATPAAVSRSGAAAELAPVAVPLPAAPTPDDAPSSEPRPWRRVPVLHAPPAPGSPDADHEGGARDDVFHIDRRLWRPGTYVLVADDEDAWPRVEKGDWLLLDSRAVPADGDLVVIRDGARARIRVLKRVNGEVRLDAPRSDVPPLHLPESRLSLAGIVRWIFRPLGGPPPRRRAPSEEV
jgi:transcriptional regulator with XRE-family HTH domain/SOS-response transcriptional repressor LexA